MACPSRPAAKSRYWLDAACESRAASAADQRCRVREPRRGPRSGRTHVVHLPRRARRSIRCSAGAVCPCARVCVGVRGRLRCVTNTLAQILRELDHENIIRLYDVHLNMQPREVWLVFEYAEYDLHVGSSGPRGGMGAACAAGIGRAAG